MKVLYNEWEPYPAQWIRNLSEAGLIASGNVDERSIADLSERDVLKMTQLHVFAGIGVWSYALRLAGWPDNLPVWTGSCPCQPFSTAGKEKGEDDARHLWPEWYRLIKKCRPPIIFGEQVASPGGRAWLDAVSADLEALGYAVGAADLCSAGIGAPHQRQRLYFVAHLHGRRFEELRVHLLTRRPQSYLLEAPRRSEASELGTTPSTPSLLGSPSSARLERRQQRGNRPNQGPSGSPSMACELGHANVFRSGRYTRGISPSEGESPIEGEHAWYLINGAQPTGILSGPWRNCEWLLCRPDGPGKPPSFRPVEPGTFPLAHGPPTRVGRLRAYGNAIDPNVAALFIQSAMDVIAPLRLVAHTELQKLLKPMP